MYNVGDRELLINRNNPIFDQAFRGVPEILQDKVEELYRGARSFIADAAEFAGANNWSEDEAHPNGLNTDTETLIATVLRNYFDQEPVKALIRTIASR
jgi:hypothetical protein